MISSRLLNSGVSDRWVLDCYRDKACAFCFDVVPRHFAFLLRLAKVKLVFLTWLHRFFLPSSYIFFTLISNPNKLTTCTRQAFLTKASPYKRSQCSKDSFTEDATSWNFTLASASKHYYRAWDAMQVLIQSARATSRALQIHFRQFRWRAKTVLNSMLYFLNTRNNFKDNKTIYCQEDYYFFDISWK